MWMLFVLPLLLALFGGSLAGPVKLEVESKGLCVTINGRKFGDCRDKGDDSKPKFCEIVAFIGEVCLDAEKIGLNFPAKRETSLDQSSPFGHLSNDCNVTINGTHYAQCYFKYAPDFSSKREAVESVQNSNRTVCVMTDLKTKSGDCGGNLEDLFCQYVPYVGLICVGDGPTAADKHKRESKDFLCGFAQGLFPLLPILHICYGKPGKREASFEQNSNTDCVIVDGKKYGNCRGNHVEVCQNVPNVGTVCFSIGPDAAGKRKREADLFTDAAVYMINKADDLANAAVAGAVLAAEAAANAAALAAEAAAKAAALAGKAMVRTGGKREASFEQKAISNN